MRRYVPCARKTCVRTSRIPQAEPRTRTRVETMATVRKYFDFLRRHCNPDNLFYCCNRVSKTLPDGEVIAFDRYPWSDRDQHLIDGQPGFYRYFVTSTFPYFTSFYDKSRHRLTRLALSS